ncbi:MAG: RNA-binding protein [Candidatus Zixiibacteriota bacterium]
MNIHVGNLSRETSEADLRQSFEVFGTVAKINIITDRATNQSKGFGFIEMADANEAEAAIKGLAGKNLHGHTVTVSEARGNSEAGIRRDNTNNANHDSPKSATAEADRGKPVL